MARAFVVNEKYHDFAPLQNVDGVSEVIILTSGQVNIFHTDRITAEIRAKMTEHQITADDFIVPSGSNLLCIIATAEMVRQTGTVNVLAYNFNDKQYKKRLSI